MERLDHQRVAAARLWAAMRFPYLASALFASAVVPAPRMGSIATDRSWRLYLDPGVVARWSVEETGSMLVHQVGHLLRDHAGRAEQLGVDASSVEDWTAAADAEINDDLVEIGLTFPNEPVVPSAFECEPGGFAEDYFRVIRGKRACPGDCGSGAHAQPRAWETEGEAVPRITPAAQELLRCRVAMDIRSRLDDLPGSVPLAWQRWADELLEPRVDWRRALGAAIRSHVATVIGSVDYTYLRPSRRASVTRQVVLPAMRRPIPAIAVVVDTSASMEDDALARVLAEVDGILRAVGLGRSQVHVLACDTEVHKVQRLTSSHQVQLFGGGGTDMAAGIDAALALRPTPSVVVVLTDGLTPWPTEAPKRARVVAGILGRGEREAPEWTETVQIESLV